MTSKRLAMIAGMLVIGSAQCLAQDAEKELKEDFKQKLYLCQVGLMGKKEYMKFVDDYLETAERKLGLSLY